MLKITVLVLLVVVNTFYVDAEIKLTCPPPTLVPVCQITCKTDTECNDVENDMCCPTACGGSLCQRAVTLKVREQAEKPGTCPKNPGGHWICSNMCNNDSDCPRKDKCCPNRCGAMVCQKPETELDNEIPAAFM
uniref:Secreted Waprin protein n=1 Tax=Pristhesancus plagipennis TaxID=1955184 RepID=A0A2K8JSP6_PRIPG|nr:secreted Waprin protein [Pristhesancus plagipennis]